MPGRRYKIVLRDSVGSPSTDPSTMHLVLEYTVETLNTGTGTVPEIWIENLENRSVHISAQRESHSGTVFSHLNIA